MNRSTEQTNSVNPEVVLGRFLCFAIWFIPNEPRKQIRGSRDLFFHALIHSPWTKKPPLICYIYVYINNASNNDPTLKLTCRHINRRHICFNIKSISVHPLLWMNVMLDFILWSSLGCEQRSVSENFKMIMYASAGNRTRDPLLSSVSL